MYVIRPTCDKEEDLPVAEKSGRSQCMVLGVEGTFPDLKAHEIEGLRIFVTHSNPNKRRTLSPKSR